MNAHDAPLVKLLSSVNVDREQDDAVVPAHGAVDLQQRSSLSLSWGRRIRTLAIGFKGRCPTR